MFDIIMLVISIIIFVISLVWVIVSIKRENNVSRKLIGKSIIYIAFALFPLYFVGNMSAQGGIFDTIISSFLGVIRVASGENSLADTRETVGTLNGISGYFVANYTATLHFVFVSLVLGFVAGLFKNFYAKIIYNFFDKGKLYVFSDFSNRSILLAEDIRQQMKNKCAIVFLGELNLQSDAHNDYAQRLSKINAYIFNCTVDELYLHKRYLKSNVYFFLLKQNEEENLKDALILADKYENNIPGKNDKTSNDLQSCKQEIYVYLLNTYDETIAIIDAIKHPQNNAIKMNFRIINESRTLIYSLFDENPLFLSAKDDKLKILIIGGGRLGTAAAEIAAWCGQTVKIKPQIIVVDKNTEIEKQFELKYPELSANSTSEFAKSECCVNFYTCDVFSGEFANILREHPDVGFVICTLGDNETNIKVALKTTQIYEQLSYTNESKDLVNPNMQTHVFVDDPFLFDISSELKFDNKNDCNIIPFGSYKKLYTQKNIISHYLNRLGMSVNRFYERDGVKADIQKAMGDEKEKLIKKTHDRADDSYNSKEFFRVSSMAAGLHFKYKMYSALCELNSEIFPAELWRNNPSSEMIFKLKNALSDEGVVEELSILEHRRWNIYMRSQGWGAASFEMADNWYGKEANTWRNFTAKLTTCLVAWDELDDVDRWLKEKHGVIKDFKEVDRVLVRDIGSILAQVNEIDIIK